jgi:hypothetical protein
MQITKNWRRGALAIAAAGAVAAGSIGLAAPAMADPVGAPVYRALAGVGSDTTQDVMNGVASVVADSSGTLLIGSYDATGLPNPISTKLGNSFARPDGSGNGLIALRSAKDATTIWDGQNLVSNDLQFSRSSSAPASGLLNPSGQYAAIPFALDAVSFGTAPSGTSVPSDIPLGATVGETWDGTVSTSFKLTLKNIYGGVLAPGSTRTLYAAWDNTTHVGSGAKTVGDQTTGADIVPFKPQPGSGTLSFWTAQMGGGLNASVSDRFTYTTTAADCSTNPTITIAGTTYPTFSGSPASGTCVAAVQEHNGKVTSAIANAIVPFSIAQWSAQSNSATLSADYGITVTDRRNGAVLGSVDGVAPQVGSPAVLNPVFPIRRIVFNNVEFSELSSNPTLAAVFQGSGAAAYNALNPSSGTSLVVEDFGFGDITGGVTLPGSATVYTAGDTNIRFN